MVIVVFGVALPAHRFDVIEAMIHAGKLVALFGCLLAGLSFARGHHLHRAWMWQACSYGLIVLRDGVLHRSLLLPLDDGAGRWVELVVMIAANAAGVWGAWLLAHAWQVASVTLPGTPALRAGVRTAAAIMAVSITLPSMIVQLPHVGDGTPFPIIALVDALADAISLSLVAPVLLTAVGLRNEQIVWPWALLSASFFGWLCYDAVYSVSPLIPGIGQQMRAFGEAFRMFAVIAAATAGIAQHLVGGRAAPRSDG
jgi:hypothetical protein